MDQIFPKRVFLDENREIVLVRASVVVTYYIKLFCMGADRHNGILMSLLLLVAETIKTPELCQRLRSDNFILNFEQNSHVGLVFLLLILNKLSRS